MAPRKRAEFLIYNLQTRAPFRGVHSAASNMTVPPPPPAPTGYGQGEARQGVGKSPTALALSQNPASHCGVGVCLVHD